MKVIAVVLSYNSAKYIANCLKSLSKVETVVVDNASSDASVNFVRINFPKVKILENKHNLGYAGGNNVGINYALGQGADFIWIVNPDVRVHAQSLDSLLVAALSHKDGGIFASKCYFEKGYEFHKDRYTSADLGKVIWFAGGTNDWKNVYADHIGMNEIDHGQFDVIKPIDFATGASMFVRREVFEQIGLIDERYFLYYEENDFCQRAKSQKWKIYYVPKSVVWHANGQATGVGSPLVDYYTTRNRLLFGMRWAPLRTKFALIRETVGFLFTGRIWQKQGVIDFYLGRFNKGAYA